MELCLVRHAIAEERGSAWPDDSKRPLTPAGRERFAAAAAGLGTLVMPSLVVSSPYARALETADILVSAFGLGGLHIEGSLATGDHGAFVRALDRRGAACVIAVGHEPYLTELLSLLVTGDEGVLNTGFKKGGAALVSFAGGPQAGAGTLEWLVKPSALRAIARGARS